MPVKRRLSKQIDGRITPSIVAAYKQAVELRALGDPRAREAENAVDRMLQGGIRRLWKLSLFDFDACSQSSAPPYLSAQSWRSLWPRWLHVPNLMSS